MGAGSAGPGGSPALRRMGGPPWLSSVVRCYRRRMSKIQSGDNGETAPEPHLYVGASIPALRKVIAQHQGEIDRRSRLAGAVAQSAMLSPLRRVERARTSAAIAATPVESPVFVVGHWRTGTTH